MKKEYSLNEHTVSDACNSALVTLSLEHEPAAITRSSAPQALAPMRHLHSCLCPAADCSLSISRAPISANYGQFQQWYSGTFRTRNDGSTMTCRVPVLWRRGWSKAADISWHCPLTKSDKSRDDLEYQHMSEEARHAGVEIEIKVVLCNCTTAAALKGSHRSCNPFHRACFAVAYFNCSVPSDC